MKKKKVEETCPHRVQGHGQNRHKPEKTARPGIRKYTDFRRSKPPRADVRSHRVKLRKFVVSKFTAGTMNGAAPEALSQQPLRMGTLLESNVPQANVRTCRTNVATRMTKSI